MIDLNGKALCSSSECFIKYAEINNLSDLFKDTNDELNKKMINKNNKIIYENEEILNIKDCDCVANEEQEECSEENDYDIVKDLNIH